MFVSVPTTEDRVRKADVIGAAVGGVTQTMELIDVHDDVMHVAREPMEADGELFFEPKLRPERVTETEPLLTTLAAPPYDTRGALNENVSRFLVPTTEDTVANAERNGPSIAEPRHMIAEFEDQVDVAQTLAPPRVAVMVESDHPKFRPDSVTLFPPD